MQSFVFKINVTESEIFSCLQYVMTPNVSLRSMENIFKIDPRKYPDSEIAKKLKLSREKISYSITIWYCTPQIASSTKKWKIYFCSSIAVSCVMTKAISLQLHCAVLLELQSNKHNNNNPATGILNLDCRKEVSLQLKDQSVLIENREILDSS